MLRPLLYIVTEMIGFPVGLIAGMIVSIVVVSMLGAKLACALSSWCRGGGSDVDSNETDDDQRDILTLAAADDHDQPQLVQPARGNARAAIILPFILPSVELLNQCLCCCFCCFISDCEGLRPFCGEINASLDVDVATFRPWMWSCEIDVPSFIGSSGYNRQVNIIPKVPLPKKLQNFVFRGFMLGWVYLTTY